LYRGLTLPPQTSITCRYSGTSTSGFHRSQRVAECERLRCLAMNDGNFAKVPFDPANIASQFILVGVAGKGIQRGDLRLHRMRLTKYVHRILPG